MKRFALPIGMLCATAAVAASIHVDFGNWDCNRWLPVKEAAFPEIGKMVQHDGYIENYIPAGASDKDVLGCKTGTAVMLLKDFCERDFVARASLAFEGKGAPGLLLRVQREGTITGLMYSLIVYKDGVNLWRYDGKKWAKVGFTKFPVEPGKFHSLQVHARGNNFIVHVDGVRVLDVTEKESLPAGEIGLWLGEGICRAESFSVRPASPGAD
jgi:hypothetical protein